MKKETENLQPVEIKIDDLECNVLFRELIAGTADFFTENPREKAEVGEFLPDAAELIHEMARQSHEAGRKLFVEVINNKITKFGFPIFTLQHEKVGEFWIGTCYTVDSQGKLFRDSNFISHVEFAKTFKQFLISTGGMDDFLDSDPAVALKLLKENKL